MLLRQLPCESEDLVDYNNLAWGVWEGCGMCKREKEKECCSGGDCGPRSRTKEQEIKRSTHPHDNAKNVQAPQSNQRATEKAHGTRVVPKGRVIERGLQLAVRVLVPRCSPPLTKE